MNEDIGALVDHLRQHSLRTDGPFRLASGASSDWYLDGRQTTFDGLGARLVAAAVVSVLSKQVTAVGGMTMGADPIAVATAVLAEPPLKAFSVRKAVKDHGAGGRIVGPLSRSDSVAVLEDTTTTGGSMADAIAAIVDAGVTVVQAITVVDRSAGAASHLIEAMGVPLTALVIPADLGVH